MNTTTNTKFVHSSLEVWCMRIALKDYKKAMGIVGKMRDKKEVEK